MDSDIPLKVHQSFHQSVDQGHIYLYDSTATHNVDDDPRSFPQTGHIVPQLGDKPQVPPKTPDLSTKRERDPLQGPFPPGEHVLDLVSPTTGAVYSIVHNLHALAPEHAMLVPRFDQEAHPFRPQTSGLTEGDLWSAWRVVRAYAGQGREATMFFNGGPLAGASQPHLHMQFIPFQHSRPPGPEALARSLPSPALPPSSPSSLSPSSVPRLPLPWVNFYLPLPSSPEGVTPASLHETYLSLLRARDVLVAAAAGEAVPPDEGGKRASHNVFLTTRFMHLVPRRERLVRVPRGREAGARDSDEGGKEEEEEEEREFGISLNGLVYLGYWYAATERDWDALRTVGLAKTLTGAGYANEEWRERERGE